MQKDKISVKRAVKFIALSTLIITGSITFAVLYYFHVQEVQFLNERYTITKIAHIGTRKHSLPTSYLADILELSGGKKCNLYAFNLERANELLARCPLIASAELKKMPPSTIGVKYTVRTPRFAIEDCRNTALDDSGCIIPVEPFFSSKNIPTLALPSIDNTLKWGDRVETMEMQTAFSLVKKFQHLRGLEKSLVKRIDVSKMRTQSYGSREIVLLLQEGEMMWRLRIGTKRIEEQLREFVRLKDSLQKEKEQLVPITVDLRIPQLAFIHPLIGNE